MYQVLIRKKQNQITQKGFAVLSILAMGLQSGSLGNWNKKILFYLNIFRVIFFTNENFLTMKVFEYFC